MKMIFLDPEMEIERFDDVIDCLTISLGDHEDGDSAPQQAPDA